MGGTCEHYLKRRYYSRTVTFRPIPTCSSNIAVYYPGINKEMRA